jgi:hypothetical protein
MRKAFLPSLLLVLVVITHYSYDLIASFYANQLAAAKAWHSVLRAVESTVLYLAVWSLVPLKPAAIRYAAALACTWGAAESAQIAACRVLYPMDRPPPDTPLYSGLCDKATGLPLYMMVITAILLVAVLRKTNGSAT